MTDATDRARLLRIADRLGQVPAGINRRGLSFPHHDGWGATPPLGLGNACVGAQAALVPK